MTVVKRFLILAVVCIAVGSLLVAAERWVEGLPSLAGGWEGTLEYSVPSPDGAFVADVSRWNGGATTGFETSVSLRPASKRPAIRDDRSVLTTRGLPDLGIVWNGNTRLTVTCDPSQVLGRDAVWRDVTISVADRGGKASGLAGAPGP